MSNIVDLPTKTKAVPQTIVLNRSLNLGLTDKGEADQNSTCKTAEHPKLSLKEKTKLFVWKLSRKMKKCAISILHAYYRMKTPTLLGSLLITARKVNRNDFHVFLNISGHTDGIDLRVFTKGWNKDRKREIILLQGKLPGMASYALMRPSDIKRATKILIALSKQSAGIYR